MAPDEIRSFREVALVLGHIRSEIADLKKDVEESVSAKKQLVFVCLSTVIGPAVVTLAKYIVTSQ